MKKAYFESVLKKYFNSANLCQIDNRQIGWEIETLFIEKNTGRPISLEASQKLFNLLVNNFSWQSEEIKAGLLVKLKKDDYYLIYELGWNNLELISPTCIESQLINQYNKTILLLNQVYQAADMIDLTPLGYCFDKSDQDTLIIPDKRDEIWLNLDGSILKTLGHIASVHFNIDLVSLDEGMQLIGALNNSAKNILSKDVCNIWRDYMLQSTAKYETDRYGFSPINFDDYIRNLSEKKIVMNRNTDGELYIENKPFDKIDTSALSYIGVDIDLFLRSVWWHNRLRKRNNNLVLEIRFFPRTDDKIIWQQWQIIKSIISQVK